MDEALVYMLALLPAVFSVLLPFGLNLSLPHILQPAQGVLQSCILLFKIVAAPFCTCLESGTDFVVWII